MQPLQQEQRDQGCPNLDAKGVLAGPYEALHSQIQRGELGTGKMLE
jgi:hypothetical protein